MKRLTLERRKRELTFEYAYLDNIQLNLTLASRSTYKERRCALMKHKEHILIGLLYMLSPFIGQLLVEKTYFIGTEFTATAYAICWLSVVISIHHFSKTVFSQQQNKD